MSSVTATTSWSPSWSTVPAVGSCASPKRTSQAARAPEADSSSASFLPIQPSVTVIRMSSTLPVGSRQSSLTFTDSSSRSSRFTVHGTVATLGMPMRS